LFYCQHCKSYWLLPAYGKEFDLHDARPIEIEHEAYIGVHNTENNNNCMVEDAKF
jgi:hypothetical protein